MKHNILKKSGLCTTGIDLCPSSFLSVNISGIVYEDFGDVKDGNDTALYDTL